VSYPIALAGTSRMVKAVANRTAFLTRRVSPVGAVRATTVSVS
jgi:hypothetical protein